MPGQLPQIEDSVTLTRICYSPQAALVRTCGTCMFCDCLRSRGQTCPSRPKLSQVAHSGLEEGVGQGDHKGRKLCVHPRVTKCVTPCVTPGSRDRVGGRPGEWPGRRLMEDGNSPRVGISAVPIKALKALGELFHSAVLIRTASDFSGQTLSTS